MNDYLMHHGVKGMKWGVRRQRQNENYSAEQRTRDRSTYGPGGVRRINKRMNAGHSISSARSQEASRIYKFRRAAVIGGKVGAAAGGIGGAAIGNKVISKYGNTTLGAQAVPAIGVGSASVGATLGRYGGQSVVMLAGGYNPSKFRYQ